jgi:hypothetical protein
MSWMYDQEMEGWNNGMLECWGEQPAFLFHYSTIPGKIYPFQASVYSFIGFLIWINILATPNPV